MSASSSAASCNLCPDNALQLQISSHCPFFDIRSDWRIADTTLLSVPFVLSQRIASSRRVLDGIPDAWNCWPRPEVLCATGGRALPVLECLRERTKLRRFHPKSAPTVRHVATAASTARRIPPACARGTPK